MSRRPKETTWKAEPHTVAKIAILRDYLYTYFQILGRSRPGENVLYIDGFAGPGEYTNYAEGSPLAALRAAIRAREDASVSWRAGTIELCFVEESATRCAHLEALLDKHGEHELVQNGAIRTRIYQGKFVDGLPQIRRDVPLPFERRNPLFAFIDPFGATGAPFSVVAELMRSPSSEVFINFDGDGVARILRARDSSNHETILTDVYGSDVWRGELPTNVDFNVQCRATLALYRRVLRELPDVNYTFPFEMQTTGRSINYWLVFASKRSRGLEKMKEAMKRIDQTGSHCFCDAVARSGQSKFDFGEHDAQTYAPTLFAAFAGQTVRYEPLLDFALNETPLLNPKKMLVLLEQQGKVQVSSSNPKRRKGTFKEEEIRAIEFLPASLF